jgi:hypothetical protein
MIIDAMTTAHRNEYFRNLLEHQRLTLESVTKQLDEARAQLASVTRKRDNALLSIATLGDQHERELSRLRSERDNLLDELNEANDAIAMVLKHFYAE